MKINLNQAFKNLDGTTVKQGDDEITLCVVACNSLLSDLPDEKLTGDKKAHRGKLAMTIHGEDCIDISIEDVALIKELIGKMYGPLIVAQANYFLESSGTMKEVKDG